MVIECVPIEVFAFELQLEMVLFPPGNKEMGTRFQAPRGQSMQADSGAYSCASGDHGVLHRSLSGCTDQHVR